MFLTDYLKALGQFTDPRFQRVLWLGVALSLVLLAALTWGSFALVGLVAPDSFTLPFVGPVGWIDDVLSWGSLAVMLVASVFLMMPVASAFISLFLDSVAGAVEARHYPGLPKATGLPFGEALRDGLTALGVLIAANLVAFVLYALFPPAAPFIFYGLNGFLLGREFFGLAAMRRESRAGAQELRRRYALQIWLAGCVMVVPLSIPVLNLVVPVIGAAAFTHFYHRVNGRRAAA